MSLSFFFFFFFFFFKKLGLYRGWANARSSSLIGESCDRKVGRRKYREFDEATLGSDKGHNGFEWSGRI